MNKRILILPLLALSLAGCGKKTSEPNIEFEVREIFTGEYEMGQPIDIGGFFYSSDYNQGSITVTYLDASGLKVTVPVHGMVFYPVVPGEHVFTYTAGSKTITYTLIVHSERPFLSVDSNTYFLERDPEDSKIYIEDLTGHINTSYSPASADLVLTKARYAPFDLAIDHGELQYEEIEVHSDWFDAARSGNYLIDVSVINGDYTVSGTYNVIVADSLNDGNELVAKNEAGTKYCSLRVVTDPEHPNRFLLPSAQWNRGASFVTLDAIHSMDEFAELSIRFKGKNLPSFGLVAEPDAISGSYSNTGLKGHILSFEQYSTERYTITRGGSTYVWKTVYSNHPEYMFGLQDLEDDQYYRLTVGFHSQEQERSGYHYLHSVRWKAEKILNYGTDHETFEFVNEVPYSSGGWFDDYIEENGRFVLYSSSLKDITFEVEA